MKSLNSMTKAELIQVVGELRCDLARERLYRMEMTRENRKLASTVDRLARTRERIRAELMHTMWVGRPVVSRIVNKITACEELKDALKNTHKIIDGLEERVTELEVERDEFLEVLGVDEFVWAKDARRFKAR